MSLWQYAVLAGFGAFHGVNPGMGWLVALTAGLRDRSRAALARTIAPIAAGHALSVFAAATVIAVVRSAVAAQIVAVVAGATLVCFGLWRSTTAGHEHWSHLQVSGRTLVWWSFLMSSIHGAGLALAPILVSVPVTVTGHQHAGLAGAAPASLWLGLSVTLVHTLAMAASLTVVALLAYEVFGSRAAGLAARINLDRAWLLALIGSGFITIAVTLLW